MHPTPNPHRACPFCPPLLEERRVFHRHGTVLTLWDAYPIAEGHALVIPSRHVSSWFDLTPEQHADIASALATARLYIERLLNPPPEGFNIGVNVGEAAGQTISHVHVHLIPRRRGDVPDPRGGVRHVIPAHANYLLDPLPPPPVVRDAGGGDLHRHHVLLQSPLATGGPDRPLLPRLLHEIDRALHVDLAVAFILESGVRLILDHIQERLERGGRVRLLTGDYMDLTDPDALRRLLDLEGSLTLRVFEARTTSFHPKAYIFRGADGTGAAYIGSSNLTAPALGDGIEWNARIDRLTSEAGFRAASDAFDALFQDPRTCPLTYDWIDAYERRRRPASVPHSADTVPLIEIQQEPRPEPPQPHAIQQEALRALEDTRVAGNTAGLVVLATGLGKTWLAAFDSHRPEYRRVLFVAHREEILAQAKATFRSIRPTARLGVHAGGTRDVDVDVLFASVQSLSRINNLRVFQRDAFDYIVIDEFHHAAAATYRKLIGHFQPRFLLGLTATPERTDGGDLLALCQENLVYRRDFIDGIESDWLSPFRYFGVPDDVDYTNIPWRSARFDEVELTRAVATERRARNALEQYRRHGGRRMLGFCCSHIHADFMAEYFRREGIRAVSVHAGPTSAPRSDSLERLKRGELDAIFSVDMFNEGVDLPAVDTVLMLRPTESSILWTQQLGRGLRKAEGKDYLRVIDYIGNHRVFLLKLRTMLEPLLDGADLAGDGQLAHALEQLRAGHLGLPPGCEITYELETVDIISRLLRRPKGVDTIRLFYEDFRARHGVRPTLSETHHSGYRPQVVRQRYGSWFGLVEEMGDIAERTRRVFAGEAGAFLKVLETTPMTRSFKMLVLLAMLDSERLPGRVTIGELVKEVRRLASRRDALRQEFGAALDDDRALADLLERNPIDAWTKGEGTGGVSYFSYSGGVLSARLPDLEADERAEFCAAVREVADWRLAAYLDRKAEEPTAGSGILCNVSHSDGRPSLFYATDRSEAPGVPSGWTPVMIDGEPHQVNFAKIAINVIRGQDGTQNLLPRVLRGWFGADAGLPGTAHRVQFIAGPRGLEMKPLSDRPSELELWREYPREQIPGLLGMEFKGPVWQQGFVVQGKHVFLLVTLKKAGMDKNFQYEDRFLSPAEFHWQSQNRTTQTSKHGQIISRHAQLGYTVHLWARGAGSRDGRACPFRYCGEVEFTRWEGQQPITVWWELKSPVPRRHWVDLAVPR